MQSPIIVSIEWATLYGMRPRAAGCNARLGPHGQRIRLPLARLSLSDGTSGFGWSQIERDDAERRMGSYLSAAFSADQGVAQEWRMLEYPLWDLAGRRQGRPVYTLLGGQPDLSGGFRVPCYDTSLYMDDLHLKDDQAAAALIAEEAIEGLERGHTSFKIKVGRGALHMPLEAGTRRDIAVIKAVRLAAGADARIMLDANNGYNLNLAKRVLAETAEAGVHWLEEPFHEDGELYGHLKGWLEKQGLRVLVADGEGAAHPRLLQWAQEGWIDVVQYDVCSPGLSHWLALGPQLDAWGTRSGPHHYGRYYGNYATCHLSAALEGFEMVEWDHADMPGVDDSAYSIENGMVSVPDLAGFGLELDEEAFTQAVKENGYALALT